MYLLPLLEHNLSYLTLVAKIFVDSFYWKRIINSAGAYERKIS